MNRTPRIISYHATHRQQLLAVWESAVLATHHFLSASDFTAIRELVAGIDFSALDVYCLVQEETVIGFIGVAERKVEMLFLAPDQFGRGYGKLLLSFAIQQLRANKVDVNERNTSAARFYEKMGFVTYERTEKDDQGNPYPLLRMHLRV